MDAAANHLALSLAWTPAAAVAALLVVLALGWARERRGRVHRRTMKRLYKLGEELTAGRSLPESLRLLQSVLPDLVGVTDVHVYVADRASKALQRLDVDPRSGLSQPAVLSEESVGFLRQSVLLCFRNRSSIIVPDTRRSPLFDVSQAEKAPRSALFLPMFAQEDLLGVLAISDAKRLWHFSEEERAVAQHLANQLAIGMKLLEQKSLREHVVGGDRLSAVHRLVTSAATELKQPLARIADLSRRMAGREAIELSGEAEKAAETLSRLLKLAAMDSEDESAVDVGSTLRALMKTKQTAWRRWGVRVHDLIGAEPLVVISRAGILPQVLTSLLWHVGQRLEKSTAKTVKLRAFRLAAMVHAEVSWPPAESDTQGADVFEHEAEPGAEALSLRDCRDLVRSHGGQLRLTAYPGGEARLEVEIPAHRSETRGAAGAPYTAGKPSTPLTVIVLEPDPDDQHALISALCDLGHRSVPASGCEEAVELASRMRFDVLFCSDSLPGRSWPECFERSRDHVPAFVLLTRGHDLALAAALEEDGPRTLAKPVRPDELSRVLREVGQRSAAPER